MKTKVHRNKTQLCVHSDYGFERSHIEGDRCFPDFWYDPDSPPEDCHLGQNYESSTGYVHANNSTSYPYNSLKQNTLPCVHSSFEVKPPRHLSVNKLSALILTENYYRTS